MWKGKAVLTGETSAVIYESQYMWCTSSHNSDGARTCAVVGSWCTDGSSYGKTNKGIGETHKFAGVKYDFL